MKNGRRLKRDRRAFLAQLYGNHCAACKVSGREVDLTIDHVLPKSQGGTSGYANLQLLCGPCNQGKAARTVDFRAGRRVLP